MPCAAHVAVFVYPLRVMAGCYQPALATDGLVHLIISHPEGAWRATGLKPETGTPTLHMGTFKKKLTFFMQGFPPTLLFVHRWFSSWHQCRHCVPWYVQQGQGNRQYVMSVYEKNIQSLNRPIPQVVKYSWHIISVLAMLSNKQLKKAEPKSPLKLVYY